VEGTPAEKRLYDLIWKRTVASQMSPAKIEKTVVTINNSNHPLPVTATGEVVLFDGFMKLYSESTEDDAEGGQQNTLPEMKAGESLTYEDITATQRFTQAPYRYSEAQLVRRLEELGIGRPSTYAPTISTIINRGYVIKQNRDGIKRDYLRLTLAKDKILPKTLTENTGKEKGKLMPTDIGMLVNDYLEGQFKEILDFNFTAKVEKEFDEIADGNKEWTGMIGDFYKTFHPTVERALETQPAHNNKSRVLGIDPKTGKQVSARIGRFGPIVQLDGQGDEKPVYASMKKDQLIDTITLEEALTLFALPRNLGELDGLEVVIGVGKFGPYARHDGKFTSLDKSDDPYTITLERATELIRAKQQKSSKEPLKTFPEDAEILVLNGMYGPYISYKKKNYRLPKGTVPAELTYAEAMQIIEKSKK
jgi:DNA topoisomerase-1